MPDNIGTESKAAVRRLYRILAKNGQVTGTRASALELYAIVHDTHTRARQHLVAEGEIVACVRTDSRGQQFSTSRPNLWLKVAESAQSKLLACLRQLSKPGTEEVDLDFELNEVDLLGLLLEEKEATDQEKIQ